MESVKNKDIKETIRNSLGIDSESQDDLNESYVAQTKKYNLPTELLSSANKKNHVELYKGYVDTFNRVSAELDAVDKDSANSNSSVYRSLKIDETYNLNAVYLHELYFSNISDLHSEISMDSLSYMRLSRDFGTFDDWQKDFMAACKSSRCGWVVTGLNIFLQRYTTCVIDLHSTNVPIGFYPIVVMDVWQHAYYRDYLKDVSTYTKAMMKQLNWKVIEKRIEKSERILSAMRS